LNDFSSLKVGGGFALSSYSFCIALQSMAVSTANCRRNEDMDFAEIVLPVRFTRFTGLFFL